MSERNRVREAFKSPWLDLAKAAAAKAVLDDGKPNAPGDDAIRESWDAMDVVDPAMAAKAASKLALKGAMKGAPLMALGLKNQWNRMARELGGSSGVERLLYAPVKDAANLVADANRVDPRGKLRQLIGAFGIEKYKTDKPKDVARAILREHDIPGVTITDMPGSVSEGLYSPEKRLIKLGRGEASDASTLHIPEYGVHTAMHETGLHALEQAKDGELFKQVNRQHRPEPRSLRTRDILEGPFADPMPTPPLGVLTIPSRDAYRFMETNMDLAERIELANRIRREALKIETGRNPTKKSAEDLTWNYMADLYRRADPKAVGKTNFARVLGAEQFGHSTRYPEEVSWLRDLMAAEEVKAGGLVPAKLEGAPLTKQAIENYRAKGIQVPGNVSAPIGSGLPPPPRDINPWAAMAGGAAAAGLAGAVGSAVIAKRGDDSGAQPVTQVTEDQDHQDTEAELKRFTEKRRKVHRPAY